MIKNFYFTSVVILLTALFVVGCSNPVSPVNNDAAGGSGSIAVTGVSLDVSTATIPAGSTYQLTATIAPVDASNKAVAWTSSNESIATVNLTGLITAVADGDTTITAKSEEGSFPAVCTVTVSSTAVAVNGVSLNKTAAAIDKGLTETLIATIEPAGATNQNVTWTSDNESVATVDSLGVVTAVGAGEATITVKTAENGKIAYCIVTVNIPATGISILNDTSYHTALGKSYSVDDVIVGGKKVDLQIEYVLDPIDSNASVTFTSSDVNIATVSATGLVSGVADGEVTITATTIDGPTDSINIFVKNYIPITSIAFDEASLTVAVNDFIDPRVNTTPLLPQPYTYYSFSSSDESIAKVDADNDIWGVSVGTCQITVTSNDDPNITSTVSIEVTGDIKAPSAEMGLFIDSTQLFVRFSEPMDQSSLETIGNYSIPGKTVTSAVKGVDGADVTLTLSPALSVNETIELTIKGAPEGVKDLAGNFIAEEAKPLTYAIQPNPVLTAELTPGAGNTLYGDAGAVDPTGIQNISNLIVSVILPGDALVESNIIAYTSVESDGSLPIFLKNETITAFVFSTGTTYNFYVIDTSTFAISSVASYTYPYP